MAQRKRTDEEKALDREDARLCVALDTIFRHQLWRARFGSANEFREYLDWQIEEAAALDDEPEAAVVE